MATQLAPSPATTLADAFPNSTKVYVEGPAGVRVPMREITLSGGEPPLRVYDTSGPEGHDARDGLPSVRGEWIEKRVKSSELRVEGRRSTLNSQLSTLRSTGPITGPSSRPTSTIPNSSR